MAPSGEPLDLGQLFVVEAPPSERGEDRRHDAGDPAGPASCSVGGAGGYGRLRTWETLVVAVPSMASPWMVTVSAVNFGPNMYVSPL